MRDHDDGRLELVPHPVDEVQNLSLNGHVERRRRLVGDEEVGAQAQAHRDHRALAHPAGELVRVLLRAVFRPWDADPIEHVDRACERVLRGHVLMSLDRFCDLLAHLVQRMERRHWILEDHADLGTADAAELVGAELQQVLAAEQDLAGNVGGFPIEQAHEGKEGDALPRSGLPHHTEPFACVEREAHAVDRLDDAVSGWELDAEVFDLEQLFRQRAPAIVT